jgi:hypothetical protein
VRVLAGHLLEGLDDHCFDSVVREDPGRPGRGSFDRPSSRSVRNRDRHFDTVLRDTCKQEATLAIVASFARRSPGGRFWSGR